jgi:tRNA threonylcarbamoyladenosine biosynthesis protein TsaB
MDMILAIDTATRWLGIALHDGQAVIAEHGWRAKNTHTVELAPAVQQMMRRSGVSGSDVKAIAVAIGPGSYTGLRVGLGFAKGLALTLHVPLVGVQTLDIVAAAIPQLSGELVITAEAGRTRVCAGRYQWQGRNGWQAEESPTIVAWEALLEELPGPVTFAGEGVSGAARLIRGAGKDFQMLPAAANVRRAGYLAEIGWQRFKRGRVDHAADLNPIYLRDPEGA